jgi:formylglycine-generating enzyme required for sulfatase activity
VSIPNAPPFVGYAWELQSADLEAGTRTMWFSDNELALCVSGNVLPNMVPIPAGTFLMGSNAGPPDGVSPYYPQAHERPVHQVTISRPFWIGRHEVTQAEYLAVMGSNPSFHQGPSWPNSGSRPVELVAQGAAMAFCAALTAQQAVLGRVPSGYQYRLPTEAEWEYCCRAGTTTEFHCGPTLDCGQASFYYSTHTSSSCNSGGTAVVGSYAPNAWGLCDMHGNVWEWCLDAWDGSANYPSAPVVDPCVQSGQYQVCRGGSWMGNSNYCRSACRSGGYMPGRHLGFRVLLAPILP